MFYENNEQVKEKIKELMAEQGETYRSLAEKLNTSQQNIYKILNKNQLKLDDVLMVCNALGVQFCINFYSPNDEIDVYEELEFYKEGYERIKEVAERYDKIVKKYNESLKKLMLMVDDTLSGE